MSVRRKTLGDEYAERGLMRPTQFKKRVPRDEQKQWDTVEFLWGQTKVRGFKRADA